MRVEIGFGLVGCGMVGKVHAEAIGAMAGARLVAVWGRDAGRTAEFASRFKAAADTDYERFLAHPDLDIVNVCTPSGTHAEFGCRAAEAGKHVLVEKPIEISLEQADRLIQTCEAAGVKLGVIFQSRFLPAVRRLKRAVDEGRFGRLILGDAYVKWYRAPEYYAPGSWHGTLRLDGGGALINQAIHTVDLLRWIMGPAETVFAMSGALLHRQIEAEDTLVGAVRFRQGALGVIEAATSATPGFKRRLEITGERGTAILDGDAISFWSLADGDSPTEAPAEQITDGSADPASIAAEGHRRQLEEMMKAVSEGREPMVTGREGRKSLELVTALYRSAAQGQPVRVDS
jgi:predicted dehydrogenase